MLRRLSIAAFLLPVLGWFLAAQLGNAQVLKFQVSPLTATLAPRQNKRFTAGSPKDTVKWLVNGVPNGNALVGHIVTGEQRNQAVYTAPDVIPEPNTVEIKATSGTSESSAKITLANPKPSVAKVDPTEVHEGAELVIYGEHFVGNSRATIGRNNLSCRYDKIRSALTCKLAVVQETGSLKLRVTNPTPGGGPSEEMAVTVNPATASNNAANADKEPPSGGEQPRPVTQSFIILRPSMSVPPAFLWCCIIGSCLSTVALFLSIWRLNAAGASRTTPLDALQNKVNGLGRQVSSARSQYDDLAKRVNRPPTPLRTPPPPRPTPPSQYFQPSSESPLEGRLHAGGLAPQEREEPARPTFALGGSNPELKQPTSLRDTILEDYYRARSSPGAARDQFEAKYSYLRITCTNHEEWRLNKGITLRFQKDDYGWYLLVSVLEAGWPFRGSPKISAASGNLSKAYSSTRMAAPTAYDLPAPRP